ncbi:MAG: hypothetical protein ACRD16_06360 [Thermoanaerobaculia bacterium]
MRSLAFLAALGLLPILGWCASGFLRRASAAAGEFASFAGLGLVALAWTMLLETWLGLPWTILGMCLPFVVAGLVKLLKLLKLLKLGRREPRAPERRATVPRSAIPALLATGGGLALCAWVAASGRATSDDLLLFWGPKAQRFASAAGVDPAYLTSPSQFVLRPDYPPLLPFLYAWGSFFAGSFPWRTALLTLPLFVFLSALAYRDAASRCVPAREAEEKTMLLVFLIGFALTSAMCAGNAEPPLVFSEILSLSALAFPPLRPHHELAASIGLAGAVLTKVEGAAFAGLIVLVYGLPRCFRARSLRPILRLGGMPLLSLTLWVAYARLHGMRDAYGGHPNGEFTVRFAGTVLKELVRNASYGVAYAPWIVIAAVAFLSPRGRAWRAPAAVAIGDLAFIGFCYLHGGNADPTLWISWTAPRLLVTVLVCLFFAAAAPAREPGEPAGVSAREPAGFRPASGP